MSIPFQHREEACYQFIVSGFDLEDTVAWMMKEYREDPTISRAKFPETLCANTVTMGGKGAQRRLNVTAFGNAYRRFAGEMDGRFIERLRAEVAEVNSNFQALEDRFHQSQRDLKEANNVIQHHLATINRLDRENTIHQLQTGAASAADVPAEKASKQ